MSIETIREAIDRLHGFTYHAASSRDADDIKMVCSYFSTIDLEAIRAEARAEAAERAEMALALMFEMGQITRDKAVSMMRAAILADEPKERKLKEVER